MFFFFFFSSFIQVNGHFNAKNVARHSHRVNLWYSICDDVSYSKTISSFMFFRNIFSLFQSDTGEKPFPCNYCGIKFRQKDGLKRHIAAKHAPDRSKHHVCDICGKVLLSKYSLNMHLNRHTNQELTASGRSTDKS